MGPMPLVFLMFGVLAFGAGVISLLYLTETLGMVLKDVMDEDSPDYKDREEIEIELPTPTNSL